MKWLLITGAMILALSTPAWPSDWKSGQQAYDRGDVETALGEWQAAASAGDARAEYSLGFLYQTGEGVPRDFEQAINFYRLAADHGNTDAQVALGNLCRLGLGMETDLVQAYMWYTLASQSGNPMAPRNRERAAADMTPDQIAAAQRLITAWRAKHGVR